MKHIANGNTEEVIHKLPNKQALFKHSAIESKAYMISINLFLNFVTNVDATVIIETIPTHTAIKIYGNETSSIYFM
jgi:hypothetical protein